MGAHSNYVSVESDFYTAIFIFVSILLLIGVCFAFKIIQCLIKRHYYKQFRTEQRNVEQYKQISARKERTYQNTLNNFFYNRIEEDIDNMPDKKPSGKAKKLINLYTVED